MDKITCSEVALQIRRALRGEVKVSLVSPKITWNGMYCGTVSFRFGDWVLGIFNDCDELDYVEHARAPDGRTAEYDDWDGVGLANDPICLLTDDEAFELETLLENAR